MRMVNGLLAGAAVLAAVGLAAGEARAQGTWCAFNGGRYSYENCGYYSFEQCRASVSGVGGWCRENPRAAYGRGGYYQDEYYEEPRPRRRGSRRY